MMNIILFLDVEGKNRLTDVCMGGEAVETYLYSLNALPSTHKECR